MISGLQGDYKQVGSWMNKLINFVICVPNITIIVVLV